MPEKTGLGQDPYEDEQILGQAVTVDDPESSAEPHPVTKPPEPLYRRRCFNRRDLHAERGIIRANLRL